MEGRHLGKIYGCWFGKPSLRSRGTGSASRKHKRADTRALWMRSRSPRTALLVAWALSFVAERQKADIMEAPIWWIYAYGFPVIWGASDGRTRFEFQAAERLSREKPHGHACDSNVKRDEARTESGARPICPAREMYILKGNDLRHRPRGATLSQAYLVDFSKSDG